MTSIPSLTVEDFEQLAQKVDSAVAEIQLLPPEMRSKAMALKSAIEEFHKVGLTHIVRAMKKDQRAKEVLFELVEEPSVYALFAMHGLIRADLPTQVRRVIEMVRPYMQSHGGDVAFVGMRDKTVLVQLSGNCNGCSMSSVTLKKTVEESLKEQVPEVEGVEVVEPPPTNLVQITTLDSASGWVEGPDADDLTFDKPLAFKSGENDILLVRTTKGIKAYRNACAHQGLPLDGAILDAQGGTLTCPWHGFQFDSESGECFSAPQCQLEPFPTRIKNNRVWVRPE
jgi:Fe-S cluster biogenesis protein NfuA/nitrite reductase/ring-hydroxylating ferredoxin subunit